MPANASCPSSGEAAGLKPGAISLPFTAVWKAAAASLVPAYWSTESVTFFFPSGLTKTTDRVAIGLPTLVSFCPVLPSSVTSGKYCVTTLTGTIASRGHEFRYSNSRTFAIIEVIMLAAPLGLILGCATVFATRHRNLHIAAVAAIAALLTLAGAGILAVLRFPPH